MFSRKKQIVPPPDWIIVGLGNPGPEYRRTRHNIGFDIIDAIADEHRISLRERKHKSVFGSGEIEHHHVILAKPMTYMNRSGQAVATLAKAFGVPPSRVLVIADDLDMELGKVRVRQRGSSGGHNGHKSIIDSLGTTEYPRIKIGIGRGGETVEHVLSRFEPDETEIVEEAIETAKKRVYEIISEKIPPSETQS